MATIGLPTSQMEGKRRRHHWGGCGANAPEHSYQLCATDSQGSYGASRRLARGYAATGGGCATCMGALVPAAS